MSRSQVFLTLGSNKGDKRQHLDASLSLIAQRMGQVTKASSYYESQAWGMEDTPAFWNRVVILETSHSPMELLKNILDIELSLGRKSRSLRGSYEDREIDVDILFYDQIIFKSSGLSIPHPLLHLRRFVLEPMCELSRQKRHPLFGLTLADLLARCEDPLWVKKIEKL